MAISSKPAFYISQLQPYAKAHLVALKKIGQSSDDIQKRFARAEIRGYLTALNDAGIICDRAYPVLYAYYTSFIQKEVKG